MLHITNNSFYTCKPKEEWELREIIIQRIKEDGPECDLNDIDVSEITDMQFLFNIDATVGVEYEKFNGDISLWNVSNVKDMTGMFRGCKDFNCDLSKWDVSNVNNMNYMFHGCEQFNCDISNWDVSNVEDMHGMFQNCKKFNCDLSRWNVSNVKNMSWMFEGCENFNQDLNVWDVSHNVFILDAFKDCSIKPKWYWYIE